MGFEKKDLSEADIRTKYITPAIVKAGWSSFSQMREEYPITTPVVLNDDFLNYVMQSQHFKDYNLAVKTDAIGQSNINAEKLKRFVFPLPPLAEQQRIVDRVNKLLAVCDELN